MDLQVRNWKRAGVEHQDERAISARLCSSCIIYAIMPISLCACSMCSLVKWGALCVLYVRCSRPCVSVLLSVMGVVKNHQCAVPLSAVPRTVPFVECWTVPPFKAYRSPTPLTKRQIEATNSNIEGSNKLFVHNAWNQFKERNQPFTTTHWRIRSTNQCERKPFTACTEAIKKLAVRRHASINGMHIARLKAHISSVRFCFPLGSIMNGVHISWSVSNLGSISFLLFLWSSVEVGLLYLSLMKGARSFCQFNVNALKRHGSIRRESIWVARWVIYSFPLKMQFYSSGEWECFLRYGPHCACPKIAQMKEITPTYFPSLTVSTYFSSLGYEWRGTYLG